MKTKQEQIEEMENELLAHTPIIDIPFETFNEVAAAVYNMGYRKASDVIDEFVKKITCRLSYDRDSELYDKTIFVLMLNKIVAEMRQEMEK